MDLSEFKEFCPRNCLILTIDMKFLITVLIIIYFYFIIVCEYYICGCMEVCPYYMQVLLFYFILAETHFKKFNEQINCLITVGVNVGLNCLSRTSIL